MLLSERYRAVLEGAGTHIYLSIVIPNAQGASNVCQVRSQTW